jgi:acetylornithine/LysW-gamma-L-lysine aminotransferase
MLDYQILQQKYMVNTYPNRGVVLVAGEGMYLFDQTGDKYLDLMTNYGVDIFGHGHPFIMQKLIEQMQRLTTLHGSFNNDQRAVAAKKLVNRCRGGLEKVYFSNSGSEANEAALKFAVLATGKKKFIMCGNGYHGKTLGALSATSGKKYRQAFEPLLWDFTEVEFGNCAQIEEAVDMDTAAIILEPVQGEAGITFSKPGFLNKVRRICKRKNILMILDEVQSGTGRTGRFLASQEDKDLSYDIVCLGKGLAGGVPVGATLVSAGIAGEIPKSIHTSTFGGNPLACAGILATLELLDDFMLSHIYSSGEYFKNEFKSMKKDIVKDVRGRGLMLGVEVNAERNRILKYLQKNGVLAIPASDSVIRFLPPYIIEQSHIDFALNVWEKAMGEI